MSDRHLDDCGPSHFAPSNPRFSSSFDEFAGIIRGVRCGEGAVGERLREFPAFKAAYEFGMSVAADASFLDRDWAAAEPDVRRRWQDEKRGDWDSVRTAVELGWENARGTG